MVGPDDERAGATMTVDDALRIIGPIIDATGQILPARPIGRAIVPKPPLDYVTPLLPRGTRVLEEFHEPRSQMRWLILEGPGLPHCGPWAEAVTFDSLSEMLEYQREQLTQAQTAE